MEQKEKNQISKDKILNAAIVEFGTKNYDSASLNNICSDNNISKGLIYHYFENKDELFLSCVKFCFDSLVDFYKKETFDLMDMKNYLDLRYRFFSENVYLSNIFFNTIFQPPIQLKEQIKALRKEFDELNVSYFRMTLSKVTLRDNITTDEAVEYFLIFQEIFNGYFKSKVNESYDFKALVNKHEINLTKILNIILYGIAKEKQ